MGGVGERKENRAGVTVGVRLWFDKPAQCRATTRDENHLGLGRWGAGLREQPTVASLEIAMKTTEVSVTWDHSALKTPPSFHSLSSSQFYLI